MLLIEPLADAEPRVARDELAGLHRRCVHAGFKQPRKTLANSLADGLGGAGRRPSERLTEAGIDPSLRPQALGRRRLGAPVSEHLKRGAAGLPLLRQGQPDARGLRRRDDGYHDLASLVHTISLADDLRIEPPTSWRAASRASTSSPRPTWSTRAARLAGRDGRRAPRRPTSRLVKRIPAAAGLGGGSSDAAAALVGLNNCVGHAA